MWAAADFVLVLKLDVLNHLEGLRCTRSLLRVHLCQPLD
jgi:hypothetical protein